VYLSDALTIDLEKEVIAIRASRKCGRLATEKRVPGLELRHETLNGLHRCDAVEWQPGCRQCCAYWVGHGEECGLTVELSGARAGV
jgi:hypothetical protein